MKRVLILIFTILAIPLGIFMFVFGEYDDSPGAQGLGVVVGILGIVGIVKNFRRRMVQ